MRREELKLVLDTGILMLILKGDPKVADIVKKVFEGAKAYTTTVNLVEVYYKAEEKLGKQTAITWFNRLAYSKDLEVIPVDTELALKAGKVKAKYRKLLSLADAIIVALTQKEKATLITTDKRLENIEEINVKTYEIKA